MIPDFATIARRRHLVTIILRAAIVLFAAWVCYGAAEKLGQAISLMYSGGIAASTGVLWNALAYNGPEVVLVVLLIVLESRIVRWVVPLPLREPGCPKCGYSLKNLNSPICPECGTNLRD